MGIQIDVVNSSTVVSAAQLQAVVAAAQVQVNKHFGPAWGIDATLNIISKGKNANSRHWLIAVLDDADQANALGYHDVTAAGLPLAKVFARTTLQDGGHWSVTFTHELLEMLADPEINLTVFVQDSDITGRLYAYEVCDPCEDDTLGYVINHILVTDFVLPSYFELQTGAPAPYDIRRKIQSQFQILTGGYQSVFDIGSGSGWQQINARGVKAKAGREKPRTWQRAKPRPLWKASTAV